MSHQRFHSLDAMRGIAAIAVAILHVGDVMHIQTVHYAYLAVDFFFALSGFVLARAYETELRTSLSVRRFLEMRVIRLYPLFALGIIFGAMTIIGQLAAHSPTALSLGGAIGGFAFNALMLPSFISPTALFPFNGPAWSLFFELIINIAFAILFYRLASSILAMICAVAGILFLAGIMQLGHADVGMYWSSAGLGLLRVSFSFPVGVLLARLYGSTVKTQSLLALAPVGALAVIFAITLPRHFDGIYDAIVIFLATPVLLWIGAIYELPGMRLQKVGAVLGDISYPLYAIHFPLLQMFSYVFARRLHLPTDMVAIVFVVSVFWFSWFLSRHFDTPIRYWLNTHSKLHATAVPFDR